MVCDLAGEYEGKHTAFKKEVRRLRIKMRYAEEGRTSKQNHKVEVEIRELRRQWRSLMSELRVPKRLWDYGLVYLAEIRSILARGKDKRPGLELVRGSTVDIDSRHF